MWQLLKGRDPKYIWNFFMTFAIMGVRAASECQFWTNKRTWKWCFWLEPSVKSVSYICKIQLQKKKWVKNGRLKVSFIGEGGRPRGGEGFQRLVAKVMKYFQIFFSPSLRLFLIIQQRYSLFEIGLAECPWNNPLHWINWQCMVYLESKPPITAGSNLIKY